MNTELLPVRSATALPALPALAPLNTVFDPAAIPAGVQVTQRAQWPSVRLGRRGNAEAGPTGAPWVNANGWLVRMLQAREPERCVWLDTKTPTSAPEQSHTLAVADAMVYGGRWVVDYSPTTWKHVQEALEFFQRQKEWNGWQPEASLAVISDFKGPIEIFAGEYLNLLTRRQIGFRLYTPASFESASAQKAAVWLSRSPIPDDALAKLLPWVRQGGILLTPPGTPPRTEGKGHVIAPAKQWNDPYLAASETHLAITRRIDVMRLWNGGSLNAYPLVSSDAKQGVVHLVNYSAREASHDTTIWLSRPWKNARLVTFASEAPLKPQPANGGIEIPLPPLGVYAAVVLEG